MGKSYTKNPLTAGRVVDGVAFIVTAANNRMHSLNSTATLLWKLAEDGITADDAARALVEEFEVALDVATADAAECLDDLVERQILVEAGGEAAAETGDPT